MDLHTGQLLTTTATTIPLLTHQGIVLIENNEVFILHNSPKSGVQKETLISFVSNRNILDVTETNLTGLPLSEIQDRFDNVCTRAYNVFSFNCEHFIRCMTGEMMISPQLTILGGTAVLMGLWLWKK